MREVVFDTETTGIDANNAELVGLSFSILPGEGYYIPCSAQREECVQLLKSFESIFNDENETNGDGMLIMDLYFEL